MVSVHIEVENFGSTHSLLSQTFFFFSKEEEEEEEEEEAKWLCKIQIWSWMNDSLSVFSGLVEVEATQVGSVSTGL